MRGIWIESGKTRFREDLPRPEAVGECRVRVLKAGVCATDLALLAGYMNFVGIPGHEFVGVALEGPLAGRRVVGEINAACGKCQTCLDGRGRHCPQRSVLGILKRGGAFAEELTLPACNLLAVPDGVSTDAATFTEPLAAAFEMVEQGAAAGARRALVIGDGKLGLLCAQVLALHIPEVALRGRHPERLALIDRPLQWDTDPGESPPYDLVVEASGAPGSVGRALEAVRPGGTLVLKTTVPDPVPMDLAKVVVDEITVLGSRCGSFEPALAALASGEVCVEPMIEGRYGLEEGPQALERAARGGVLKLLIEVDPA